MTSTRRRIDAQRRVLRERCGVADSDVRAMIAPYRVCPLGAHVDHQHGPVLGMAISTSTILVFAPADDASCRLSSANFPGEARFRLDRDALEPARPDDWGSYARAAAWALGDRLPEHPRGIVGRIEGPLPGGGLSSSASVLLAYLVAFAEVNDVALGPAELVALSRRAENDFVGVASGILDPATLVGARRGGLLVIDPGRITWESVPLGADAPKHRVLVAFTGTTRNLAGTGFNVRVAECREAARRLGERVSLPDARVLGDLPESAFGEPLEALPPALQRRARHFAGERVRVREGILCWRRGDLSAFGRLMNASCQSSIVNYETGSSELVRLQEILSETPGVLGARFSGAGYGGCAIALVEAGGAEACREQAERSFVAAFPQLAGRARFALVDDDDGVRLA